MEIIGRDLEIGFATEAVRGTAETTADKWFKHVTANIVERAEQADDDSSRGVLEDIENRRVVQKYIEGDLEGIVHVDAIGYLLASLYGKVASSTVSGSVKDHIFSLKQNIEHQSLTIFAKDGGAQQLKFAGCMVNSFELNAVNDDFVRFKASFTGISATDDASVPSYDTEYDFIGRDVTVKIADSEAGLTAATALKVKEFNIKKDQGGIRDHILGSQIPDGVYNSKLAFEGDMTLNFVDETFKDLYLGETAKYMQVTVQGEIDLGGGYYPTVTYVFNKVKITDWNRSGGKDELVTQSVSFKAYYNESDQEASKVTLRNLTSLYANVPSN